MTPPELTVRHTRVVYRHAHAVARHADDALDQVQVVRRIGGVRRGDVVGTALRAVPIAMPGF